VRSVPLARSDGTRAGACGGSGEEVSQADGRFSSAFNIFSSMG